MHVRFLDDCRERPLGLPTRLKERGEVTSVADPRYLQLHRPHPRVPGTLAVAVALPHASGTALVTPSSYVLLDLHLHEGLGEHPHALLEEVRVLIDHRLAQQLREPYPQLIGHRVLRFGRLVSSEGTTRWPSSSTARSLFTHSRGHYLNELRVCVTAQQQCCASVTQVVEAYLRKPCSLEQRLERPSAQVRGVDEGAYAGGEDESVVAVEITQPLDVF